MRLAFLITSLFITSCSWGQFKNTRIEHSIDSVQALLQSSSLPDTLRLTHLHHLAQACFYDMQFERGFDSLTKARELAVKMNYPNADELFWITMSHFHQYTTAGFYYNRKHMFAHPASATENWLTLIDDGAYDKPYIEKMINALVTSVAGFERKGDKAIEAQIYLRAAFLSGWIEKYKQVDSFLNRSIRLFSELRSPLAFLAKIKKTNNDYLINPNEDVKSVVDGFYADTAMINNFREYALIISTLWGSDLSFSGFSKKPPVFEMQLLIQKEAEQRSDTLIQIFSLENLGVEFAALSMPEKAIEYYKRSIPLREKLLFYSDAVRIYFNLGFELVAVRQIEEAKGYFDRALQLARNISRGIDLTDAEMRYADASGQILMQQGKFNEALASFSKSYSDNGYILSYEANCYFKLGKFKESILKGEQSYRYSNDYGDQRLLTKLYLLLANVYDTTGQSIKAHAFLKKYRDLIQEKEEDNIASYSSNFEIQRIIDRSRSERDKLETQKLLKEKENQNQRLWIFSIAGALLSVFVLLLILFRNYKTKQKANTLLEHQKNEIQSSLTKLKATQAQLIQSEKMASLGELTAGIAHEIQNPLNFVNNFSDVNTELVDEAAREIENGNMQEVKALLHDIKDNEQKINHHGRRADAIVKGMLQHSRTSTGQKELTDINVLADEYLRLAYRGLRVKDETFHAIIQTDFDKNIDKINIIPQDVGRVLFNLYNNAFYAINEKRKERNQKYEPTIAVSTKKVNDKIEIKVSDNGNGIPQKVLDKIFQPFFTTKPTGQGTGLGLSLAYDIVKAHGGQITAQTKEGEHSEFTVTLPI